MCFVDHQPRTTKLEGPKSINSTMIYISSDGRCQKIGSTFLSRKRSILGLYISLWGFNMPRYLLFLVNQVCFLCVSPYPVFGPLNEICHVLKGDIYVYVLSLIHI